jgi:hypothetical protein
MAEQAARRTPFLLLPFVWLWRLLGLVITVTSRIVCALLGLLVMVAGVVMTMTVFAAPLGIPISVLGFLLLVRALF